MQAINFSGIKVPSGYDSRQVKLSKHFGLVEFVPFVKLIAHEVITSVIVGLENDSLKLGFEQPTLNDYLPLQIGDILFWKYEYSVFLDYSTYYYKDSLKSIDQDSLEYTLNFERTYDSGDKASAAFNYNKLGFPGIVESPPDYVGIGMFKYIYADNSVWKTTSIVQSFIDTIEINEYALYSDCMELDTISCDFISPSDCGFSFKIDTYRGLKYTERCAGLGCDGYERNYIVGSIINGFHSGNTWVVGMEEGLNLESEWHIYPNPANHWLKIDYPDNWLGISPHYYWQIFNPLGILQSEGVLGDQARIDVSKLAHGIHILTVCKTDGTNYSTKFVKW